MTIEQIEKQIFALTPSDLEFVLRWSERNRMQSVLSMLLSSDERRIARRLSKIEILEKGEVDGRVTFHLPSHVYSRLPILT